MMEDELRQLLKEHGWNLLKRKRRERVFLYAQKWKKGEIYIASSARLPQLTEEDVLRKIEAASA